MSELFGKPEGKKEILKRLIRQLHEGANPATLQAEFRELIKDVSPAELSSVEEELIREGMPREEVRRLCDLHLAVFREALERGGEVAAPAGHPVHILMAEHRVILEFAGELKTVAAAFKGKEAAPAPELERLEVLVGRFRDSESHYLREENVLFPYLERHGVTEPPAIMWMEHDRIREIKKRLYGVFESRPNRRFADFVRELEEVAGALYEMLSSHFYKENNILFPTALRLLGADEWGDIRAQFDELGYCGFTPEGARVAFGRGAAPRAAESPGAVDFPTGSLSPEELAGILNTLPVDITFVDRDDRVRYFNESRERIFPRTRAVLGRKVQQCHPQKSIHVVNQILEDFKNGRRDVAEFWINLKGRLVYIRYFAVRGKEGAYLGCIEVTQDVTGIKGLEGEKRLL